MCCNQKAPGKACCATAGGEPYFDYLKSKLVEKDVHGPGKIRVSKSGCLGRCSSGPCMVVYPEGVWYAYSSFAELDAIIESHLIGGQAVETLLIDI